MTMFFNGSEPATANGNYPSDDGVEINRRDPDYEEWTFSVSGTFGGGSVKLEQHINGESWAEVPNSTLSAAGAVKIPFPKGIFRMVVSGATGASINGDAN